jgi:hypothetical protein
MERYFPASIGSDQQAADEQRQPKPSAGESNSTAEAPGEQENMETPPTIPNLKPAKMRRRAPATDPFDPDAFNRTFLPSSPTNKKR